MDGISKAAVGAYPANGVADAQPTDPHLIDAQHALENTPPVVTFALLGLLTLIFALNSVWTLERPDKLYPGVATLIAWGGNMRSYVVQGDWFRLVTAGFLHGGILHLLLNLVCLYFAGKTLEPLIGRLWFAGLFVVSGIGGALASLAFNEPQLVSVGASGAIMGLFVTLLLIAWRYPAGALRKAMQKSAVSVLIPSMLPVLPVGGMKVDIANHAGGALAGGIVGCLFLFALWPVEARQPRLKAIAAALCIVGAGAFVWAGIALPREWLEMQQVNKLVAAEFRPKTDADMADRVEKLIKVYPNDARLYYFRGINAIKAKDAAAAEAALRHSVTEMDKTPRVYPTVFIAQARAMFALAVADRGQADEAKEIATKACAPLEGTELKKYLRQQKMCD